MSAEKNWQFELEEYMKQGELGRIEKSEVWQAAIGLQAVDGLKVYFLMPVRYDGGVLEYYEERMGTERGYRYLCCMEQY